MGSQHEEGRDRMAEHLGAPPKNCSDCKIRRPQACPGGASRPGGRGCQGRGAGLAVRRGRKAGSIQPGCGGREASSTSCIRSAMDCLLPAPAPRDRRAPSGSCSCLHPRAPLINHTNVDCAGPGASIA